MIRDIRGIASTFSMLIFVVPTISETNGVAVDFRECSALQVSFDAGTYQLRSPGALKTASVNSDMLIGKTQHQLFRQTVSITSGATNAA